MNKVMYQFPTFLEKIYVGDLAKLKQNVILKKIFLKKIIF